MKRRRGVSVLGRIFGPLTAHEKNQKKDCLSYGVVVNYITR
jgi:hypothetical protein